MATSAEIKFYGQLMQDAWVIAKLNKKRNGYFVDIGAHEGVKFSNSYLLETAFQWQGLCIEASPESFEKLQQNRKCKCIKALVAGKDDERLPFAVHPQESMLSGIDASCKDPIYMQSKSLMTLLKENNAPQQIDFISLDTEGNEPNILETFDCRQYDVTCWTIEHNGDAERASFIAQWLSENGYLFKIVHWDFFAIKDWANP